MDQLASNRCNRSKGIQRFAHDLTGNLGPDRPGRPAIGEVADAPESPFVHEGNQRRAPKAGALGRYLRREVFLKAASARGSFLG